MSDLQKQFPGLSRINSSGSLTAAQAVNMAMDAVWSESDHPRAENGQFGNGGKKRDNQGRDLAAVKRHLDAEETRRKEGELYARKKFQETVKKSPVPEFTKVEGIPVYRSGNSRYVAAPRNGKETSRNFDIIDLEKREHITTLNREDAISWIWRMAKSEAEEKEKNAISKRK